MKILVAVPNSWGNFQHEFAMSLITLQAKFYEWAIANKREDTLSFIVQHGVQLDEQRNDLVKHAIEHKMTHILFLDSDMSFPPDMISTMVGDFEDNPEVEAITGLYTWKHTPYLPHVYPKFNKEIHAFTIAGEFALDRLMRVEGAGTGCLMIDMRVFERTAYPWFRFGAEGLPEFDDVETRPGIAGLGEDMYFCLKAKPLMLLDPRIQCKHYRMESFDINNYIDSNGLKRTLAGFEATPEQIEQVASIHRGGIAIPPDVVV